jgi:phage tail sheath protein FI
MPELLHPGVYVVELPSAVRPIEGVSTSTAAFIGVTDKGPIPGMPNPPNGRMARPVLVTSFTDYQRQFGGFRRDSFMTYAVQAFYQNGGQRLYIVRIVGNAAPMSPPVPPCSSPMPAGTPALPAFTRPPLFPIWVSAINEGAWGNNISVLISDSSDGDTVNNFKLTVFYDSGAGPQPVETYDRVTYQTSPNLLATSSNPADYVRTVVNSRSEYIAITRDVTSRPANSPPSSPPTSPPTFAATSLSCGTDGPTAQPSDYVGAPAPDNTVLGTGLHALDKVTDVSLIAMPGLGDFDSVNKGMEYCKVRPLQDCFFIADVGSVTSVDSARADGSVTDVSKISDAVAFAQTKMDKAAGDYGAIYFPWVRSGDPIGSGRNPKILLPPSGFVAGIYARIDNSRGVFKAPAGTEAGVFGAVDVETTVSDTEQDSLNPISVNVIRTVPGSGFVVWGARTIGSDSSWRYVPVRRMAIFLRVSIYYGIQWAVFEPNDEPLWAALRLNIRAFMLTQFRAGAFQGSKPDDAFFVKCDSSTTTQQDIDNGVVNILVGFAPLKPAEFVVLKLSQKVNQPAA